MTEGIDTSASQETRESLELATLASETLTTFDTFAVSRGKGSNATTKTIANLANGALTGALIAQKIGRKALIDSMAIEGMSNTVKGIAYGSNYRHAIALVVAVLQRPYTAENDDGKVTRAAWLRLRVEAKAQASKASIKAVALWDSLQAQADAMRAA